MSHKKLIAIECPPGETWDIEKFMTLILPKVTQTYVDGEFGIDVADDVRWQHDNTFLRRSNCNKILIFTS